MQARVHYFCSIATDALNERYCANFHVGPASRKVIGTCAALARVGARAVIVSALIPFSFAIPLVSIHRIGKNIPYVRLFALRDGILRRLSAAISFCWYSVAKVKVSDEVLLYNAFPEYVLAAAYLKIVRRPAVLDVEDAPREDEGGARGLMNRVSFFILRALCDRKTVTVSEVLAKALKLERYYVNYGVSFGNSNTNLPGAKLRDDKPLNILFGGAIMKETGADLFCEGVRRLAVAHPAVSANFHITGRFDRKMFTDLQSELGLRGVGTAITIHGDMSATAYTALLESMDVGLCLKLPSHSMGQTTFPSKVVEICAAGMLLCSTSVSDVPRVFNSENSVILPGETADDFVAAIVHIWHNKQKMRTIAQAGHRLVSEKFGEAKVGADLANFLFEDS